MRSDEPAEQKSINNLKSMIIKSTEVRVAGRTVGLKTFITWNRTNSMWGTWSNLFFFLLFFLFYLSRPSVNGSNLLKQHSCC